MFLWLKASTKSICGGSGGGNQQDPQTFIIRISAPKPPLSFPPSDDVFGIASGRAPSDSRIAAGLSGIARLGIFGGHLGWIAIRLGHAEQKRRTGRRRWLVRPLGSPRLLVVPVAGLRCRSNLGQPTQTGEDRTVNSNLAALSDVAYYSDQVAKGGADVGIN
jgi:hypothetical protein